MVSLQQRKAQSLSSSTLSSSKGRHIYWKTSSARYSLSTYLLHLVMESGLSGAQMGVSNTASKCHGNQGKSLMVPGQCLAGPPCASAETKPALLLVVNWGRTMFCIIIKPQPFSTEFVPLIAAQHGLQFCQYLQLPERHRVKEAKENTFPFGTH